MSLRAIDLSWRKWRRTIAFSMLLPVVLSPQAVHAQATPGPAPAPASADHAPYSPISGAERVRWIVKGNLAPRSFAAGVLMAGWQTAWNLPSEWDRTWAGAGKRYLAREPHVAVSNVIEAGLGALWGEDPRYVPSRRHGVWPRVGYAIKVAFLAPGRDGRLRPAWARYVSNATHTAIETAWLPPSTKTPLQTGLRFSGDFAGQMVGDLWDEFWPDVHRLLQARRRRAAAKPDAAP